MDDQGQPLNRLGIPEPAGLLGHGEALRFELSLAGQPVSVRSLTAAWFDAPPGEPIVATRRRGEILHQEELALIVDLVEGAQYTVGFTPVAEVRAIRAGSPSSDWNPRPS